MRKLLKTGLIAALLVGMVWLLVIIWWQETRKVPTGEDIALFLVALPVVLLAGWWMIAALVRGSRKRAEQAAQTPVAVATNGVAESPAPAARLSVIAIDVATPLGNTPSAVLAALREARRPAIDPTLRDAAGYPVFAARLASMQNPALRADARLAGLPHQQWPDEVLRTFALAHKVIEPMLRLAGAHEDVQACAQARAQHAPGATRVARLGLIVLVPDRFVASAGAALEASILSSSAQLWPLDAPRVVMVPTDNATDVMASLEQSLSTLTHTDRAADRQWDLAIVAAADSTIGEHAIQWLDASSALLKADNPQGMAAGEAGCAMLLATADWAGGYNNRLGTSLTSIMHAARANSADDPRTQSDTSLTTLSAQLLKDRLPDAPAIAALTTDADHRGTRPVEIASLARSLPAPVDNEQDCLSIGAASGAIGATATVLSLALGAQLCADSSRTVMVASARHPTARTLILAEPEPVPAGTSMPNMTSPSEPSGEAL